MPFKLSLVADVAAWLKGTADVEASLDSVADSLDDLARDTAQDADKAATDLKNEFTDAFDKVKTEAATTGRKLGDDIHDGTRKATEGVEDFKQEASQTARETAASFDGSADSIADMFQELSANAFSGFGPAGAAAGLAAAAGIGLVSKKLEEAEEAAEASRERISELATELAEVDGQLDSLDWSGKLKELLYGEVEGSGETWIAKYGKGIKALNLDSKTFVQAMTGDKDALDRVAEAADRARASQDQFTTAGAGTIDQINASWQAIARQNTEVNTASTLFAQADAAMGDWVEQAERAKESAEEFSGNLTNHLSVADEGLSDFVKDGKLSLQAWADELEKRAKETKLVQDFTVDVGAKLSPEALQNFQKLPTETQTQIAKAYGDGKGKKGQQVIANLEAEAKVSKVTVDTSGITAAPVEIPTTVISTGVPKGVADASNTGQSEANKSSNAIEFKTKIDHDALQRQVNRAAAAIVAPVIYATVKAKKEQP